jgi:hypothetical protein
MSKKIKFMAGSKLAEIKLPPPEPARSKIPEWYRQADRFIGGKMIVRETGGINKDLKLCVPFLDSLVSGYVLELPCDIHVERLENGSVGFFWHELPEPIEMRSKDIATTLPRPSGHDHSMYAWKTNWATITPPGYSSIFTHPLNRFDLPFTTTSGIMDTDKYSNPGEIPFFLKEGFEGTIEAGTPIVQIIPLKRDSWKSEILNYDPGFIEKFGYLIKRKLFGGYRDTFWQKKSYS